MHPVDQALFFAEMGEPAQAQQALNSLTTVFEGLDAITVRSAVALPEQVLPEALAELGRAPFEILGRGRERPQHLRLGDSLVFELALDDRERASRQELEFKNQLRAAGLDPRNAALVAAAFSEMQSNALEHSESSSRPLACWWVRGSGWAFGVYDVGRGVLASLRENPSHSQLDSHSEALSLAVTDFVSGRGSGRGMGFHELFKALLDRRCTVRLRTGDTAAHAVGHSPTRRNLTYTKLTSRAGFCVSVSSSG